MDREAVESILRESPVVDMHSHVEFAERFPRRNLARRHLQLPFSPPRWGNGRVDLPGLRAAHVDALVASAYAMEFPLWSGRRHFKHAMEELAAVERLAERYPQDFEVVRSAAELQAARGRGRIGLLIALEGAHGLAGSLDNLEALYARGLRSLQPAHWLDNACLKANRPWRGEGSPLTSFGREVVKRAAELGMVLDLAHISVRAFRDVLELVGGPVIASHAGVRALCNLKRNLRDEQLRALAERGGVLGMTFYPPYLFPCAPLAPLGWMVEHIDHVVQLVGPEHVGLGSDHNGAPLTVWGLGSLAGLGRLVARLLERGYERNAISGILGGNFLRVLAAAAPE